MIVSVSGGRNHWASYKDRRWLAVWAFPSSWFPKEQLPDMLSGLALTFAMQHC